MDVGDRVIYVGDSLVKSRRDFGTVISTGDRRWNTVSVLFDDGRETEVACCDLKIYKETSIEQNPTKSHLHFGCIDSNCPEPAHRAGFTIS